VKKKEEDQSEIELFRGHTNKKKCETEEARQKRRETQAP